jgi:hypothetical protein
MILPKKECHQRSIEKDSGMIDWTVGLFFLLFLAVFIVAQFQTVLFQMSSSYLEDALAASNLASAVIDPVEYSISGKIVLSNPEEAFERYCYAVKSNLNLDSSWECANKHLIAGQVCIVSYILYNVCGEDVETVTFWADGRTVTDYGKLGQIKAPNGKTVTQTGIYSELSFPVKGIWGVEVMAHKGKLVDILTDKERE